MNLSNLKPAAGSVRNNQRRGRGTGSGMGGTATRGHKGAQSRSGYKRKVGFEGGQTPLQRRVPKSGFNNPHKVYFKVVNLDFLQELAEANPGAHINFNFFQEHGIAGKRDVVKVLARGEVKSALKIEVHAISEKAKAEIEKVGGTVTLLA